MLCGGLVTFVVWRVRHLIIWEVMEAVNREGDIGLEPPDLDNVLFVERIVDFKKVNPEFYETLKQACVIRESTNGWFDNIKKKILTKVKGV